MDFLRKSCLFYLGEFKINTFCQFPADRSLSSDVASDALD
jgi:hypothetical protein